MPTRPPQARSHRVHVLGHHIVGRLGELIAALSRGQSAQQVVVKSLEANYGAVNGASAATILGDGLVALILDIDSMLRLAASGGRPPQSDLKMAGCP